MPKDLSFALVPVHMMAIDGHASSAAAPPLQTWALQLPCSMLSLPLSARRCVSSSAACQSSFCKPGPPSFQAFGGASRVRSQALQQPSADYRGVKAAGSFAMSGPAAKRAKTDGEEAAPSNSIFQKHSVVLVLDYGSQYTQLIARRVRENKILSVLMPGDVTMVSKLVQNPRKFRLHSCRWRWRSPASHAWPCAARWLATVVGGPSCLPAPSFLLTPACFPLRRSASSLSTPRPSSCRAGPTAFMWRARPACPRASLTTARRAPSRCSASVTACRCGSLVSTSHGAP
jgi:hypothetical protein